MKEKTLKLIEGARMVAAQAESYTETYYDRELNLRMSELEPYAFYSLIDSIERLLKLADAAEKELARQ